MIRAIWPSYNTLPNALSPSSGVSTRDFLSFFLFWWVGRGLNSERERTRGEKLTDEPRRDINVDRLCQLPFMFIHPSKLGWLFLLKAIVTPIVCLGTLIWVRPGRLSLLKNPTSVLAHPSALLCIPTQTQAVKMAGSEAASALSNPGDRAPGGTARFYSFMFLVTSTQGTWATMSCNIGDFSRFVCRRLLFRRTTFGPYTAG
jgi:NCS1 family nucleobase:cation symporter-1